MHVLVEALLVGLILVLSGLLVGKGLEKLGYGSLVVLSGDGSKLSQNLKVVTLFLAGALAHVVLEYTGVNKSYAQYYGMNTSTCNLLGK